MMATIEIDDDLADSIITESLKSTIEIFQIDLTGRLNNQSFLGVFHNDRAKDIMEILKHLDAFNMVLNYYKKHSKFENILNNDDSLGTARIETIKRLAEKWGVGSEDDYDE